MLLWLVQGREEEGIWWMVIEPLPCVRIHKVSVSLHDDDDDDVVKCCSSWSLLSVFFFFSPPPSSTSEVGGSSWKVWQVDSRSSSSEGGVFRDNWGGGGGGGGANQSGTGPSQGHDHVQLGYRSITSKWMRVNGEWSILCWALVTGTETLQDEGDD